MYGRGPGKYFIMSTCSAGYSVQRLQQSAQLIVAIRFEDSVLDNEQCVYSSGLIAHLDLVV